MDFFPVGAVGGAMGPTHESEGAIDKGTMSVSWNKGQGTAIYSVWRFGTVWEAEAFFALLSSGDEAYGFGPCNGFATPAVHANEFAVTCGWSNFAGYRANMDARYEEFVIGLYVGLDEEMTSEDFRRVVVFVDHQMTAKLNPK